MVRYFFILSRRDPDLYAYLKDRFADDTAVEVIMDRRHAPPAASIPGPKRERRRHPDADAELMLRSYTVVTVPDAADGFSRLKASATA